MPKHNNIGDFLDKVPPQDLEAEQCLLGSLLLLNETVDVVDPIVSPKCFYADCNRRIYSAIHDLFQENRKSSVDAVTLRDELDRRGELETIGGTDYLIQLLEKVPHAAHAEYYAEIVREKYRQRQVIEACAQSLKDAYSGHAKVDSIVSATERRLMSIAESSEIVIKTAESAVSEMLDRMHRNIENDQFVDGVEISWEPLKELIDGFYGGGLYVLAARPSQGKTALALACCAEPLRNDQSVLFVSLEMPAVELAERLTSSMSMVSSKSIRSGKVPDSDQVTVMQSAEAIGRYPIRMLDETVTISTLRQIIRKEVRTRSTRFVVIDYLQLIDRSDQSPTRTTADQISDISRKLKLVAKELKIPILLLSQLNRGVEQRDNKTPRLSDLRDSGAIEQDADVVIFLHRPESYDPTERPGIAILTVAKNRHGPIGTAELNYDKTCGRFYVAEEQLKLAYTPEPW